MVVRKVSTKSYDHSRIEQREYTVLPLMYLHQYKEHWPGLQNFIRVKSTRILASGEYQSATRYYITSINFKDYRKACFAIREHWQIENALHYKLDVGLHEDESQIFRGHAAENLGYMRKIVLKLLNDENSCGDRIALKRVRAALSTRYFRKVMGL